MVQHILVNGKKISNTEKGAKPGRMVPNMRDFLKSEKNMGTGLYILLMVLGIKGTLIIMKYKDMEFMCGQTERDMKVNGYKIRCRV